MQAPNAEEIETAQEQLAINKVPQFIRDSQRKELHSACGEMPADFVVG